MDRGILGIGVCTLDVLTKVSSFPENESVEEAESSELMGGRASCHGSCYSF